MGGIPLHGSTRRHSAAEAAGLRILGLRDPLQEQTSEQVALQRIEESSQFLVTVVSEILATWGASQARWEALQIVAVWNPMLAEEIPLAEAPRIVSVSSGAVPVVAQSLPVVAAFLCLQPQPRAAALEQSVVQTVSVKGIVEP